MGDRIGLKVDGDIDRIYKIGERFREGVVADMKFCGFVPSDSTVAAFPWLRAHFGESAEIIERFEDETGLSWDPNGPLPDECEYCGKLVQYFPDHHCIGIQSASRESRAFDWQRDE